MAALALAFALCCPAPSRAQQAPRAFDLQTFQPAPGRGAAISLPHGAILPHQATVSSLIGSYARGLLSRRADCDPARATLDSSCFETGGITDIVPHLAQLELAAAVGLHGRVELGVVVPVVIARVADELEQPGGLEDRLGAGDLRLSVALPVHAASLGAGSAYALSLRLTASLPTGDEDALLGAGNWTALPQLVGTLSTAAAEVTAAVGYRLRERVRALDLEHDDELELLLGASVPLVGRLDGRAELRARFGVGGELDGGNEDPLEGNLALGLELLDGLHAQLGAGTALWPGRDGYGAPELRVLGGIRWASAGATCRGPDDVDGYRDDDGCPEPDNDGDGVPDRIDVCPLHAEDRDRFVDEDGCPDPDNDADGLRDAVDRCPRRSEDRDGFEDDDGCPEPDNDGDGLADGRDTCPMEPEDADGFEDGDGCPETGPAQASVTVGEGRLLVSERIYFEYDRDTLRDTSLPTLDRLAEAIAQLPAGTKVIVEGHTDDDGAPAYNLDLSYRRARAVVLYLQSRGVPASRLEHRGMGDRAPLVDDRSPAGRALNRRVEFLLSR